MTHFSLKLCGVLVLALAVVVHHTAAEGLRGDSRNLAVKKGDNPCDENEYYGEAFKCSGDDEYLWCVGDKKIGYFDCPKGTDCQCDGSDAFNPQNPCGSWSARANCVNEIPEGTCDGNKDGVTSFVCLGHRTFATCYGETPLAKQKCPKGTKCQCPQGGKGSLTSSNPCGSVANESECEPADKVPPPKGGKKSPKSKGKKGY